MARPTLSQRVTLFIESEMAGKTDKADLAKALKAAAKDLEAGAKPTSGAADRPAGSDDDKADTKAAGTAGEGKATK